MIYPGTDLKWLVTVEMNGFCINEDDMELVIKNSSGQVRYTYKADDFYTDGEGHWLFRMPNVPRGVYHACLSCWRGDGDFPGGFQRVTSEKHLVDVGICGCQRQRSESPCCETDGMTVNYERVWTVNYLNGVYLADCVGRPIRDRDGNLICFSDPKHESKDVRISMLAEEFSHWVDGRDDNGRIGTRREIEDALTGVGDKTSLGIMTDEEAADMTDRILGKNKE